MNKCIQQINASNQQFIIGSYTEIKFSKRQSSQWQNCIPCDRSILYSPFCDRSILYSPFCLSLHQLLIGQFCNEIMRSYFNKKEILQFFKKGFERLECFKLKVLKIFEVSSGFYMKMCRSYKWRIILKISSTVIQRSLSASFKIKPLRRNVFLC